MKNMGEMINKSLQTMKMEEPFRAIIVQLCAKLCHLQLKLRHDSGWPLWDHPRGQVTRVNS